MLRFIDTYPWSRDLHDSSSYVSYLFSLIAVSDDKHQELNSTNIRLGRFTHVDKKQVIVFAIEVGMWYLSKYLDIMFMLFGFPTPKVFDIIWLSNILAFIVPNEGYSRNGTCAVRNV